MASVLGAGGGGAKVGTKGYNKRKITKPETKIEEMEAKLKERGDPVEEEFSNGGGKRRSNSGNPALEAHGGTCNHLKTKGEV